VDDGVPSRGHRKNFFGDWKVCGNFTGSHSKFRTSTVIDYAGGFINKDSKAASKIVT
jgi:hypothetical protein